MPAASALSETLAGLLDRAVIIKPSTRPARYTLANRDTHTALYVNDDGFCTAAAVCDRALGAGAAAAIAMVPADAAAEWSNGTLPQDAADNLNEVLNVLATSFNTANPTRRVKLFGRLAPGRAVAEPTRPLFTVGVLRTDLDVTIDGYPGGKLVLFSAP
jgi:hypothetical protein